MAFNQRTATPLEFSTSPLLPQADSSQAHDIPTGVSPTTAKLQDWIAWLVTHRPTVTPYSIVTNTTSWSATADGTYHDTGGHVDTGALTIGDVLTCFASGLCVTGPSSTGSLRIAVVQDYGGTNTLAAGTSFSITTNSYEHNVAMMGSFVIAVAGIARVVLQLSMPSLNSIELQAPAMLHVTRHHVP